MSTSLGAQWLERLGHLLLRSVRRICCTVVGKVGTKPRVVVESESLHPCALRVRAFTRVLAGKQRAFADVGGCCGETGDALQLPPWGWSSWQFYSLLGSFK